MFFDNCSIFIYQRQHYSKTLILHEIFTVSFSIIICDKINNKGSQNNSLSVILHPSEINIYQSIILLMPFALV